MTPIVKGTNKKKSRAIRKPDAINCDKTHSQKVSTENFSTYSMNSEILPLICNFISSQICLKSGRAETFGILMCTDARTVVPKFVGQKVNQPKRSSRENGKFFSIDRTPLNINQIHIHNKGQDGMKIGTLLNMTFLSDKTGTSIRTMDCSALAISPESLRPLTSLRRELCPGFASKAVPLHTTATSSTSKVAAGAFSSGESSKTLTPE
uniref:Uncharacterized protein n=1 Tax=Romanomermis culicivorax TaxID=13658 RepID=A0A915I3Z0_ROMCU